MCARPIMTMLLLLAGMSTAAAQQLDARFSCSESREEGGERVILADNGEFRMEGSKIDTFRWESAEYRPTHGFDCSIDDGDGLLAEVRDETSKVQWRVALADALNARTRRGYDFSRGMNCTIRIERDGDMLNLKPTCPALCGSRSNFSELSVNMKTGECRYEE